MSHFSLINCHFINQSDFLDRQEKERPNINFLFSGYVIKAVICRQCNMKMLSECLQNHDDKKLHHEDARGKMER
jgi:hypothetical protein